MPFTKIHTIQSHTYSTSTHTYTLKHVYTSIHIRGSYMHTQTHTHNATHTHTPYTYTHLPSTAWYMHTYNACTAHVSVMLHIQPPWLNSEAMDGISISNSCCRASPNTWTERHAKLGVMPMQRISYLVHQNGKGSERRNYKCQSEIITKYQPWSDCCPN